MKKLHFVLILICHSLISVFGDSVDSTIKSVEIYTDGAVVNRVSEVNLEEGENTLVFDKIPKNANNDYLQAKFLSGPDAKILRAYFLEREDIDKSDSVVEIDEKIKSVDGSLALIADEISILDSKKEFAQSLAESFAKNFGEVDEGKSHDLDEAEKVWSHASGVYQSVASSLIDIKERKTKLEEKRKDLIAERMEMIEKERQLNQKIELVVLAKTEGTYSIEVQYRISSARWEPLYEFRAFPEQDRIDLNYQASITQQSGEDWTGVAVNLSTSSSRRSGDIPELNPLIVNKNEYQAKSYERSQISRSGVSAMLSDEEVYTLSPFSVEPEFSQNATSFYVSLPYAVDVASSAKGVIFPITETTIKAKFWSEAVPVLTDKAYLKAKGSHSMEFPVLPGRGIVFVDNVLTGEIYLDEIFPEESFELSLGVDANVRISRRDGSIKDKESGFIGKKKILRREYFTTVKNFHAKPYRVLVLDQFPVSRNEQIIITPISPKESEVILEETHKDDGKFKWNSLIPAGGEKEFKTQFEVSYPSDWQILPPL